MTACFADSTSDVCHTSTPMSKSSSSSSDTTALTWPAVSSPLEGLEDLYIHRFVGIVNMRKAVKSQSDKLQAGDSNQQYLVFRPVTEDDLAKIDRARQSIGSNTRMAHYIDEDLLIVKLMPSAGHEGAHVNFGKKLCSKTISMGMTDEDLYGLGSTRFPGRRSSKEGDSAYKPLSRGNRSDWPTIVIESGLSESLRHLRADAKWWLENSGGDVGIVILISIKEAQRNLLIEKWELALAPNRPITRAFNNPNTLIPTKMQEIRIDSNIVVTGAPLVLEFRKIFLRPPTPPENDIVFTVQDLSAWATQYWAGLG